jgi:EAL domain-containing protein (putative c-di-GMP-specific phosphodiesterase class I)
MTMRRGTVEGFEALLRWQHPRDGLVPPLSFLPLIEDSDLIIDIGEWVIEQALGQLARWAKADQVWPVSVNIAARHFNQANFVARLQTLMARYPCVSPQWLNIELLESVALEDIQKVSQTMAACNALGVSLSLDDFGTGYSSLSYLKRLPAKVLKIDRSFVRDILDDKDDLALTEAIIALSVVFSRDVVAEGVENAEQGVLLMRLGCDVAQGFGIARPMPAEEVIPWVQQFQPDPKWAAWAHLTWDLSDFPLLMAQHDHLHWVRRLIMAIDGANLTLSTAEVSDHHQCRFGHWYEGPGAQQYGHLPEFVAIGPVHEQVHQLGGEIIRWRDAGDLTQARVLCGRLLALKDQILLLLGRLQGVVLSRH